MTKVFTTPVAKSVPFDNTSNGFTASEVQAAIEEIGASASPGFSWGRSASIGAGTWLLNESVPSNTTGRYVSISSPKITQIFTSNEDISTYTITIYEHEGNSVNLTPLTTLDVTASRGNSASVDITITQGRQLAVRVTSGSAKNVLAGVIIKGSST